LRLAAPRFNADSPAPQTALNGNGFEGVQPRILRPISGKEFEGKFRAAHSS
jgi:hypothetical protein